MLQGVVWTECKLLVRLVNNAGKVRGIRPSITLRSNMERLARVLGVALQEQLEERVDVLASDRARVDGSAPVSVREADVYGLVKEDDIGVVGPAVRVVRDVTPILSNRAWAQFEEEAG